MMNAPLSKYYLIPIRNALWVVVLVVALIGVWAKFGLPDMVNKIHFELADAQGRVVNNFEGQWTALVFGFTSCPDVCPALLSKTAFALGALGSDAENLKAVFVNVDEKDAVAQTARWLAKYDTKITALHGNFEEVQALAKQLGGEIVKTEGGADSSGHAHKHGDHNKGVVNSRLFVHPTSLFLISPQGKLKERLPFVSTPQEWAETIRRNLTAR